MDEAKNITNAQAGGQFLHLIRDGIGTSRDDVAVVDELLPTHARNVAKCLLSHLRRHVRFKGLDRTIAGCIRKSWVDVQTTVVKVIDVFPILLLGFFICFRDDDGLCESRTLRRIIFNVFFDPFPVTVHQLFSASITRKTQIAIHVVIFETEIVRLQGTAAGDEDGRW